MSYSKIYDRHSAILEFIRSNSKPRTHDILEYLEDIGDPISLRTVQRALKDISTQTSATIVKRGLAPNHWYEIEDDSTEQSPLLYSFLEHSRLADTFRAELKDEESIGQIIYPDMSITSGLDLIPKLIPPIKNRKQINFDYSKFDGDSSKRKVCPYYLKQFRKRWYLIGLDKKDETIKSFGLDRMSDCKATKATFTINVKDDHKELFDNVIGFFENDRAPIKITLWSKPYNANYMRTLRLHSSQREIGPSNGGFLFELTVVDNYEFYQEILRMADDVEIISPESVRMKMVDRLNSIKTLYE